MTLASQRACTLGTIRQGHTALLLNVDGTLGFGSLGLGFVLLLLFLGLLVVLVGLAFLALLRIVHHALGGALLRTLLPPHGIIPIQPIPKIIIITVLSTVGGVPSFFLSASLFLLGFQTSSNMVHGARLQDRALAVLANDSFKKILLTRFARRK